MNVHQELVALWEKETAKVERADTNEDKQFHAGRAQAYRHAASMVELTIREPVAASSSVAPDPKED